jgi:hypothetical protein
LYFKITEEELEEITQD